jgi:hypothetical protein
MKIAFNQRYELKPGLYRCHSIPGNVEKAFEKEFRSGNCIMSSEKKYLFTGIPLGEKCEHYFFVRREDILAVSEDTTSFMEIVSSVT